MANGGSVHARATEEPTGRLNRRWALERQQAHASPWARSWHGLKRRWRCVADMGGQWRRVGGHPAGGSVPCGTNHGPTSVTHRNSQRGAWTYGHYGASACVYQCTTACWRSARAMSRTCTCSRCKTIRTSFIWPSFTQKISTKVLKHVYTKVVDLTTLYNFYNGS
jgi:hypothetical protein